MCRNFLWPPDTGTVIEYCFQDRFHGSHVLSGTRPAIIYRRDDIVYGIPVTTAHKPQKLPTHLLLPEGTGGLPMTSLGLVEAIQTISSEYVEKKIGCIDTTSNIWKSIKKRIGIQLGVGFVRSVPQSSNWWQGDIVLVDNADSVRVIISNNVCNSTSPVVTTAQVVTGQAPSKRYIQADLQFFGKLHRTDVVVDLGKMEIFDKITITATIGSCNRKKLLDGLSNFLE